MPSRDDVDELVGALARRERRAIARLLTLVEDGGQRTLPEVIGALHPRTGDARIIGLTGSPGVGKSTIVNAVVSELRDRDRTVGVVAIDPSSPFSGGALLGDRVRMQSHYDDDGVFIRSMAARGHLGGIAFATPQAVLVLDAAGFDDIIIETVGVGQSEVEVASTADTTVVCVAPGMGDAIQAAKAGILEVADVFLINKADHGGAGKTESELRSMLELGHEVGNEGWWPPIVRTVAIRSEGIGELVDAIDEHHEHLVESGTLDRRRTERAAHTVREIALSRVREQVVGIGDDDEGSSLLDGLAQKVAHRDLDPYSAADELLEALEL